MSVSLSCCYADVANAFVALTENEVRKELANEEARRLAAGGVSHHSTSASVFVTLALDLEETQ